MTLVSVHEVGDDDDNAIHVVGDDDDDDAIHKVGDNDDNAVHKVGDDTVHEVGWWADTCMGRIGCMDWPGLIWVPAQTIWHRFELCPKKYITTRPYFS